MKIPQSLLDAKDVLEARFERNSAIRRKNKDILASGAQASAHIPDVEHQITELAGVLLQDDALKGVADEECLTAPARADAEKQLARSETRAWQVGRTGSAERGRLGSPGAHHGGKNTSSDRAGRGVHAGISHVRKSGLTGIPP